MCTAIKAQPHQRKDSSQPVVPRAQTPYLLLDKVPDVRLTGHPTERLPNNASLAFKGMDGESIMLALDLEGICVSTGSACTTGETEPSFVLKAMGLPDEWAIGSVRMTLGHATSEADIEHVLGVLPGVIEQLRANRRPVV